MYELRNGALKIAFPENGGGMPETITLLEAITVLSWNSKTEPFSLHVPESISRMKRTE